MFILYVATAAFLLGGGMVTISNLMAQRSRSRYF